MAFMFCVSANAETFLTSYYGHGERLNTHTTSGERFNPQAMTAAHRTLPFGTKVRLTNGDKSVVVRINDRGPAAWTGRDIDITSGAAKKLGLLKKGVDHVNAQILLGQK